MADTAPTLDPTAAAEAADAGIATSDEHALEAWKKEADRIIEGLARALPEFTADEVWATGLGPNPTGVNAALGARFRAAARSGWIEKTDRTRKTTQVQSHAQPVTIWRSLYVKAEEPATSRTLELSEEERYDFEQARQFGSYAHHDGEQRDPDTTIAKLVAIIESRLS